MKEKLYIVTCHDTIPLSGTKFVTTWQVVLLDLSSFSSSAKREVMILVRSDLCYEALSTYTSQRRLARSSSEFDRVSDKTDKIQEVELKVLPLPKRRFIYIIEVALKLLFESRNPMNTILGYDTIARNPDES